MAGISHQSSRSDAIVYYVEGDKPHQDRRGARVLYASSEGVSLDNAVSDFREIRRRAGKEEGFKFYDTLVQHAGVEEFDPDDPEDVARFHELGVAMARELSEGGRFAFKVVTQADGLGRSKVDLDGVVRRSQRHPLQNHIIMSAVAFDGRSKDSTVFWHETLAKLHDEVLERNGYRNPTQWQKQAAERTGWKERAYEHSLFMWEVERDEAEARGLAFDVEPPERPVEMRLKDRSEGLFEDEGVTAELSTLQAAAAARGLDVTMRRSGDSFKLTWSLLDDDGRPVKSSKRRETTLGRRLSYEEWQRAVADRQAGVPARPKVEPEVEPWAAYVSTHQVFGEQFDFAAAGRALGISRAMALQEQFDASRAAQAAHEPSEPVETVVEGTSSGRPAGDLPTSEVPVADAAQPAAVETGTVGTTSSGRPAGDLPTPSRARKEESAVERLLRLERERQAWEDVASGYDGGLDR